MFKAKPEWLINFDGGEDPILIRRSKDPFGWMGNMSPFPVKYGGLEYRTTEALFQCLRLKPGEDEVRELIRAEKSPMAAKFKSKKYADRRGIECLTEVDLDLMRNTLRTKLEQHTYLQDRLWDTGDRIIIEDCTKRQRGSGLFWGAALQEDGTWTGANWLGRLWMELREDFGKDGGNIMDLLG